MTTIRGQGLAPFILGEMKMKKLFVLMIVLIACVFSFAADRPSENYNTNAVILASKITPYKVIWTAEANDTYLTASTSSWTDLNVSKTNGFVRVDSTWNYAEFAFIVEGDAVDANYCSDPNLTTFDFQIYGAAWYSSARVIYDGNAICGELELDTAPDGTTALVGDNAKWVDTISAATLGDCWSPSSTMPWLWKSDNTKTDNGIATITVDLRGLGAISCRIQTVKTGPRRVRCVARFY